MRRATTEGKSVFAEWVRAQDPDILAMQETNDFTQIRFEELARSYGHGFAVLGKEPGMPGSVEMRTKFPVSVSSKTPVVNVDKVLDLSLIPT